MDTWSAIWACVANQTPSCEAMWSSSSVRIVTRERCPMTCGWRVSWKTPPSA
nr:hypothetical protein [Kibdelosporangium sp. MJ126-NF4]